MCKQYMHSAKVLCGFKGRKITTRVGTIIDRKEALKQAGVVHDINLITVKSINIVMFLSTLKFIFYGMHIIGI